MGVVKCLLANEKQMSDWLVGWTTLLVFTAVQKWPLNCDLLSCQFSFLQLRGARTWCGPFRVSREATSSGGS